MSRHRRDDDEGAAPVVLSIVEPIPPEPLAGKAEPVAPGTDAGVARPVLRIVKGDPTPEELAVLLAIVAARGSAEPETVLAPRRGGWGDPAQLSRRQLRPGLDGWRNTR